MMPAIATGLLGLGSGIVSAYGAHRQNEANVSLAQRQMDFQERMSSTAYQRATADMRKAGLNPLLAYSQGGATSPSGASAHMHNVTQAGVSSALEATKTNLELQMLKAQTEIAQNTARVGSVQADIAETVVGSVGAAASAAKDVMPWLTVLYKLLLRR